MYKPILLINDEVKGVEVHTLVLVPQEQTIEEAKTKVGKVVQGLVVKEGSLKIEPSVIQSALEKAGYRVIALAEPDNFLLHSSIDPLTGRVVENFQE